MIESGNVMYIVAIAWIYVVLMMSITERSVIAGIMTFLLYGLLPLVVILYLMGAPQRKRNRRKAENMQREAEAAEEMKKTVQEQAHVD